MALKWKKLPGLEHGQGGCLTCGPKPLELGMDAMLATGFGDVTISKNGDAVWCGDVDENKEASYAEELASKDPDHDWRVTFYGPMREPEYQRQGEKLWVLVRMGQGFA